MNQRRYFFSLLLLSFVFCVHGQVSKNYLDFKNSDAYHNFYQHKVDKPVIIQGHRGTVESGFPESSIAAMEYVLSKMPAVFEIDPRLTRDSVIVVFHDATLERTTNGTGKLIDYTWEELKKLKLKNKQGELTSYRINTLAEVLEWARGKTALVLDKKDVPLPMIAGIIRKHNANSYVSNMVRSVEDALFYYNDEPDRMLSVSMRTPEVFHSYIEAGIPPKQMFACIGTELNEQTSALCQLIAASGMRCLMATASSYDKLPTEKERTVAYRKIIQSGVSIIETDYPVQLMEILYKKRKN